MRRYGEQTPEEGAIERGFGVHDFTRTCTPFRNKSTLNITDLSTCLPSFTVGAVYRGVNEKRSSFDYLTDDDV